MNLSFIHKSASQWCYIAAQDSLGPANTYTCSTQKCSHSIRCCLAKEWWDFTDKNMAEKHHSIFEWSHKVTQGHGYFHRASSSMSYYCPTSNPTFLGLCLCHKPPKLNSCLGNWLIGPVLRPWLREGLSTGRTDFCCSAFNIAHCLCFLLSFFFLLNWFRSFCKITQL